MAEGDYIFFGTDPKCGHVVCAVVDRASDKRDTAKTVAQMIRDGYDVSRRLDQQGIVWCNEECPRMIEVRAEQENRKAKGRRK